MSIITLFTVSNVYVSGCYIILTILWLPYLFITLYKSIRNYFIFRHIFWCSNFILSILCRKLLKLINDHSVFQVIKFIFSFWANRSQNSILRQQTTNWSLLSWDYSFTRQTNLPNNSLNSQAIVLAIVLLVKLFCFNLKRITMELEKFWKNRNNCVTTMLTLIVWKFQLIDR